MGYNIIVLVKQMPDLEQVKPDPSTGEPQLRNVPLKVENLSENSIVAAVRLKEKYGGTVTAIIFGTDQSTAIMKKAYDMGADNGYIITGYQGNDVSFTARVLAQKIKNTPHDITILGNQSADSISGLLAGKLSALLGEPLVGNAISVDIENGSARVKRVLEDHNLIVEARLPAIVSVTQEINEPRLPPVMQIMAAGRKPINSEKASLSPAGAVRIISNRAPKSERKKIVIEDVDKRLDEIVKVIKEEMR